MAARVDKREFPNVTRQSVITELGIDSLSMMQIVGEMETELGVIIPDEDLVELVTVGDLCGKVEAKLPALSVSRRRIAVTGLGVVSPVGNDVAIVLAEPPRRAIRRRLHHRVPHRQAAQRHRRDGEGVRPRPLVLAQGDRDLRRVTQLTPRRRLRGDEPGRPRRPLPLRRRRAARPRSRASIRTMVGCLLSTGQGAVEIFEEQIARSTARGPRAVSPYFIPGVMPNSGRGAGLHALRPDGTLVQHRQRVLDRHPLDRHQRDDDRGGRRRRHCRRRRRGRDAPQHRRRLRQRQRAGARGRRRSRRGRAVRSTSDGRAS